jgi:hypothetical protein
VDAVDDDVDNFDELTFERSDLTEWDFDDNDDDDDDDDNDDDSGVILQTKLQYFTLSSIALRVE